MVDDEIIKEIMGDLERCHAEAHMADDYIQLVWQKMVDEDPETEDATLRLGDDWPPIIGTDQEMITIIIDFGQSNSRRRRRSRTLKQMAQKSALVAYRKIFGHSYYLLENPIYGRR